MGAEGSTFCSASNPGGYLDADHTCTCAPSGHKFESKRMQVSSADGMGSDRINPWTKDLGTNQGCGSCVSPTTVAPKGYLADTQDEGAIVLDSREGPLWMDEERDSRTVDLDPGEDGGMRIPEAVARMQTAPVRDAIKPRAFLASHEKALADAKYAIENQSSTGKPRYLEDLLKNIASDAQSGRAAA
mmetsp:Transcript_29940/g.95526  ORF Transcript_29940/g.95526 Transcript_29940/m.95526 type:complete len:187 (-) Transcript_29940:89-649(-)